MKSIFLVFLVFLVFSCNNQDDPEPHKVVYIGFNYSVYNVTTFPYHDVVRLFFSDPNLPLELSLPGREDWGHSYVTFPGQYYMEYAIFNQINTTHYMIYEIFLMDYDRQFMRNPSFKIWLTENGPRVSATSGHTNNYEYEVGMLPLSMTRQYLSSNHGPILNSATIVSENGYIRMWSGKLNED